MKQTKEVMEILKEIDFRISIGEMRIKTFRTPRFKKLNAILGNKIEELKDMREWITDTKNYYNR